jgi:Arc/MetJ-type ribon-helix-helix transcriptional regulator
MKTAQLPPVRVDPPVRAEIVAALREGESLSEFVKTAALEAARRRKAQDAFLARGRAALEQAQSSGEWYDADAVLDAMRDRLADRVEGLRQAKRIGSVGTP